MTTSLPTDLVQPLLRQTTSTPDGIAVRDRYGEITYAELGARVEHRARQLRAQGIGPGQLVAICMERSIDLVVSILAVVRAGGAYVPIDPGYPLARIDTIFEQAAPDLVFIDADGVDRIPVGLVPADLDSMEPRPFDAEPSEGIEPPDGRLGLPDPESIAYVIFTSGSTGVPKGVLTAHRPIANRIAWMQESYRLRPGDRVLQKTPIGFDVSVWEFFWPLSTGATLVMAPPGIHADPDALAELIRTEQITVCHFVPSMLRHFVEGESASGCLSLRDVIVSGEELPSALVRAFRATLPARLHNLYGPTEAAIDVTAWTCGPADERASVPIGRPIDNVTIAIVGPDLAAVPAAERGQIAIGGLAPALGYHRRPDLTADRFRPDPRSGEGGRLYLTGDAGRVRPDGAVEYLGREDGQVKVAGVRIELGEVEQVLAGAPGVRGAAVLPERRPEGGTGLRAYVVLDADTTPDAVRSYLSEHLPRAVVPDLVLRADLPVGAHGKVDRARLRASAEPSVGVTDVPATAVAVDPDDQDRWVRAVQDAFASVLGRPMGRHDDFLLHGGDSLRAIRCVRALRRAGADLDLRALFDHPTPARLGRVLAQPAGGTTASVPGER